MACALACGERPDLPGAAVGSDGPSGAGDASGNGGAITVLEGQTRPPPEPDPDPSPPVADAGSADDDGEGPPSGDPVAEGAGPAAVACAEDVSD